VPFRRTFNPAGPEAFTMFMLVAMLGSARVSSIVPVTSKTMSSVPLPRTQPPNAESVFADMIASRSEQFGPVLFSSSSVFTTIVAAFAEIAEEQTKSPIVIRQKMTIRAQKCRVFLFTCFLLFGLVLLVVGRKLQIA
jgi:hypothetical protein